MGMCPAHVLMNSLDGLINNERSYETLGRLTTQVLLRGLVGSVTGKSTSLIEYVDFADQVSSSSCSS